MTLSTATQWVTKDELCAHFQIGKKTVDRCIASGRIPPECVAKIGAAVRLDLEGITQAFTKN